MATGGADARVAVDGGRGAIEDPLAARLRRERRRRLGVRVDRLPGAIGALVAVRVQSQARRVAVALLVGPARAMVAADSACRPVAEAPAERLGHRHPLLHASIQAGLVAGVVA